MKKGKCHKMDLRGCIVPFTYLKVSQVFRALDIGDCLEIRWDEADSLKDLFKILPKSTYEVLHMTKRSDDRLECNIMLKKTASAKAPPTLQEPHWAAAENRPIK